MKKNCWLILGTLVATSAVAQVNTNALPEIPAPAGSAEPPAAMDTAAPAAATTAAPAKKAVAKKKHVVKPLHEPTVSLTPGEAVVTAHHLNVRGQAGMRGEVIGKLDRGQMVTVLTQINLDKHAADEPAQWAKIALPADVKVWVSSHFVDKTSKTVTAKRLNLRAGPGENFSVVGTIEHGAPVTEIASKGSWIEIQPPTDSFAFVAAMYLDQTAIAGTQGAGQSPAPGASQGTMIAAAPAMTQAAPANPPPAPATETHAVVVPPPGNVQPAQPMTASAESGTAGMGMTETPGSLVVNTNPPPPRVATHEGYVRSSVSPVAPTAYELYDPATGNAINYLNSPTKNLDLSRYDGTRIIVTGEEGLAARWGGTPVMTVQRIYLVSTNPPVPFERVMSPRASQKNIPGTKREKHH
jgi:uncharacterized protein YgiM (DUF1202 family)